MTTHPPASRLIRHHPEKLVFVVGDGDEGVELHSRPDFFGSPTGAFSLLLNSLGTLCWPDFNFGLDFFG